MREWTVEREGIRLAVAELGDSALPAAVIAHGVGSCREFVAACFARPLLEAGFQLVTYDLRGHARSTPLRDPEHHALEEHAADLAAVADAVGARLIGGISLGGHAATLLATSRPEVGGLLVALPGWVGAPTVAAALNAAAADEVAAVGIDGALARMAADESAQNWVLDEVRASWSRHDPASLVAALRAAALTTTPDHATLSHVAAPTGIAAVDDDMAHPVPAAQALADAIPNARLATISLFSMATDRSVLGAAAVQAWRAATSQHRPERA